MANSKYEYVRQFEQPDALLANTWIVVRIDGRGFSKFTSKYEFVKPNDKNGLDVMNAAAQAVMKELPDLVLAFGNSDEYSKLTTTIVSTFTSYYVWSWSTYFPDKPLTPPLPSFDGRAVCYPSDSNLRDYMSWRQVDCHINNLYNTTFWTLLQQGGMGAREAEQRLKGTVSSDKNEILFKEFGINYNNEPECFKKGTVLYRDFFPTPPPVEQIASPVLADFPTPPIAQPTPKRASGHRASQSIERAIPYLPDQKELMESPELCSRPTFLSTTSTPSPPPSPPNISRSAFPNPLRSNPIRSENNSPMPGSSMPLSPPSTATWNNNPSSNGKQHLPSLTPLPLSPPILKPSSKPPLSLNQPNPTTRTNFSPVTPQGDFPADFPIAGYRHHTNAAVSHGFSHSASASLTTSYPPQVKPSRLKQRSPSQPSLPTYFASSSTPAPPKPPSIPLRISSIPANSKPRKLSLPVHRSTTTLKATRDSFDEKESVVSPRDTTSTPPRKVSPPIQKNKALPSPPMSAEEEMRTREKVKGNSPQQEWNRYAIASTNGTESPQRRTSDSDNRGGHVWGQGNVSHPGIAELHAVSTPTHSAPTSASLQYPHSSPDIHTLLSSTTSTGSSSQNYATSHPLPSSRPSTGRNKDVNRPNPSKSNSSKTKPDKGKQPQPETGSRAVVANPQQTNEGRPVHMSRTQKDKDRKKRSKATVLMEHVDIIKDEFWEKRPWILSGKTG
ncbi:Thg1 C terminal domain-containing protein [Alternaria alternata]|nr:Thg1 C terminal domain-containing protein [Alternaria alternata]